MLACLLTLLASLAGCASAPPAADAPLAFVIVRHAEKATNDPHDPDLDAAGHARARALAGELRAEPLAAVYATEYRRTRQTAGPVAARHRLPVQAYYARATAAQNTAHWRQRHRHGTVLVVGHSNTVPDLVAALCGCTTPAMSDEEYDRLTFVRFDAQGQAQVETRRYGAPRH